MRLKILFSAMNDLYEARLFYEEQGEGLGDYFFDAIFSDIDSLVKKAPSTQAAIRAICVIRGPKRVFMVCVRVVFFSVNTLGESHNCKAIFCKSRVG